MSWLEGEIVGFDGKREGNENRRKIRSRSGQPWREMPFFYIRQALELGYTHEQLQPGRRIRFRPGRGSKGPIVQDFAPPPDSSGASTHFLNPYHFVPLAPPPADSLVSEVEVRQSWDLHGRFGHSFDPPAGEEARFSGRVVCRITTRGPVVVGGEQKNLATKGERGEGTRVEPFELEAPDGEGERSRRPAIPGSTLRGMVSAVVEAASCSTLRVLPEATYTRRGEFGRETLSAIGRLERGEAGELVLRPLTAACDWQNQPDPGDLHRLRYYLDGYRHDKAKGETRLLRGKFLDQGGLAGASASNDEDFWYARLQGGPNNEKRKRGRLIGRTLLEPPIPHRSWHEKPEADRVEYTRGLLMVFGIDGSKKKNLPPTKKHELFIPYPENDPRPTLPIAPEALEEFHALLEDSAKLPRGGELDDLPYLHAGRDRKDPRPRAGDLVYFEQKDGKVRQLSYSAAWRRPVPGSLHGAIRKGVSEDLVPFHSGRHQTTLAERLFGFVESDGQRALAGRVRFAHALAAGSPPDGGWYQPEVTLAILASPKPPSPAFYFDDPAGKARYLSKKALDLREHIPKGRKVYLHHRTAELRKKSYTSESGTLGKLERRVRPLATGTPFLFHVDFTNLTREELGFLLYGLEPTVAYRHRLGLGKPLGLGSVELEPLALCFIDRHTAYGAKALLGPKYQEVETQLEGSDLDSLGKALEGRYRNTVDSASATPAHRAFPDRRSLVAEVRQGIPKHIRRSIEILGDPDAIDAEVTYPRLLGQEGEQEHFRWFVENDRPQREARTREFLDPRQPLKKLVRHRESERRH